MVKMNQELFNEYFFDTKKWIKKSRELMISASYLILTEQSLLNTGKELIQNKENQIKRHPFESYKSVILASPLLIGLALENILKADHIKKGIIKLENSKIKGLTSNHDLLKMLNISKYELSSQDKKSITQLTFQLQSLGRYHIAKNSEKQNEYSGIIVNPTECYDLVNKIIKEVLTEDEFASYFNHDETYDHIPQSPNFS